MNPGEIIKYWEQCKMLFSADPSVANATISGGYWTRGGDPAYWFIRGSEQLQIEFWRKQGISANGINGIGPNNDMLDTYLNEAIKYFFK